MPQPIHKSQVSIALLLNSATHFVETKDDSVAIYDLRIKHPSVANDYHHHEHIDHKDILKAHDGEWIDLLAVVMVMVVLCVVVVVVVNADLSFIRVRRRRIDHHHHDASKIFTSHEGVGVCIPLFNISSLKDLPRDITHTRCSLVSVNSEFLKVLKMIM